MKRKYKSLTRSEEELMELFWTHDRPFTSVEILKIDSDNSWSANYLQNMLRSLLNKDMIKVCGSIQYGTQYARQFAPVMKREEYVAKIAMAKGIEKSSIADVTVALVKEAGDKDDKELIKELEVIIKELREHEEKEK